MIITDALVNLEKNQIVKLRLESSHGMNAGYFGHYTMNVDYFKKCIIFAILPIDYIEEQLISLKLPTSL